MSPRFKGQLATKASLTSGCAGHWPWTFLSLSYSSFDPTLTWCLNFHFWKLDSQPFSCGLWGSVFASDLSGIWPSALRAESGSSHYRLTLVSRTGYHLSPSGDAIPRPLPQLSTAAPRCQVPALLGLTYPTAPWAPSSSPDPDHGPASFENRVPKQWQRGWRGRGRIQRHFIGRQWQDLGLRRGRLL